MRVAPVVLQLASQAGDGDIDRAVERAGLPPAQQVQQHVAGQHPVGALHQGLQQVVFAAGQGDLDPVGVEQAAAGRFQRPAVEAVATDRRIVPGFRLVARAAQDGAYPGEQLTRVERLRHVVVGAKLEADDAVGFLAHRGEHDDGDGRLGAQPAREVEAGFAGQHEVEHDELVVPVEPGAAGFLAVAHRGDADALLFQETREQVADVAVIIDDEDVGRLVHAM